MHIRWMIRRDMEEVLVIEESLDLQWLEIDYLKHLRKRNCIGTVLEVQEKVLGCMVYELQKEFYDLIRIVIHPNYRYRGYGTAMINKLKSKLIRRKEIITRVPETNVPMQLFLKKLGFEGTVVKQMNGKEDIYEFFFTKQETNIEEDIYILGE